MNPPTPAVRISRSSSSSSALSSPSPSSSSSSSGTATPNHSGLTNGHSISDDSTLSSGLIQTSVPRRAASSLSNSSFSSQSSQQTVKASQLSHSIVANGATNGGLAVANGTGNGNGTHRRSSKSPSRRSPGGENVSGGSTLSEAENVAQPGRRSRSGTGSSRTALPLALPTAPPTITSSTPSSSRNEHSLARQSINIVDALRTWFSQSIRASPDRGTRIAFVLLTVVLPLAAFIMRLRIRRRLPSSSSAPGSGRRLVTRPGGAGNAAGTVRWLYEAVRDGVVMAGKGLV